MALEPEFWEALSALAQRREISLVRLVAETDAVRGAGRPLASALRILALRARG